MEGLITAALLLTAYLLGSIPTAVWISKGLFKDDVRKHGSGNAGSTNMFRIYGAQAGIMTQLIDITKGVLAAALPYFLFRFCSFDCLHSLSSFPMETQALLCGLIAVTGHIYPVFAGFRGGKGINTMLGMMLVVNPLATLICLLVFVIVLFASSYVSLGSILATLTFPLFLAIRDLARGTEVNWGVVFLGFGMFLLVCYTHRTNIQRLRAGKENRVGFVDRWKQKRKK